MSDPQSRVEEILQDTLDGQSYDVPPLSRVEQLLKELNESGGVGGGTRVASIKGSYDTYAALVAAHPTGVEGDAYLVGSPSHVYVWDPEKSEWHDGGAFSAIEGPKGPKGDKGDKGEKGDTGDTGPTGATGPKGDKGNTGATGATGPAGADGKDGKDGKDGLDGSAATIQIGTVSQGVSPGVTNSGTSKDAVLNFVLQKGDKGDKGDKGEDGKDGRSFSIKAQYPTEAALRAAHPTGQDGDAYFVGDDENPDLYVWLTDDADWYNSGKLAGIKGDKGDKGDAGFSPVASVSKSGDTVTIVIRDSTGQTTETVKDGKDGVDGQNGSDGADGKDGQDGSDGVGIVSIDFKETDQDGNNVYTITLSDGNDYDITCPKGATGATGNGGFYGTSNTSGATSTKVVTTTEGNFTLYEGATLIVKFSYDDTAGSTSLKVDGTSAKAVKKNGQALVAGDISADTVYEFAYTGSYFEMVSGGGGSDLIDDVDEGDFNLTSKQLSLKPARRSWTGTHAEWEQLTTAQKTQFAFANFTDDSPYADAFVDAITDGDMRGVTSNAVYDFTNPTLTDTGITLTNGTLTFGGYYKIGKLVIIEMRVTFNDDATAVRIEGLPIPKGNTGTNFIGMSACSTLSFTNNYCAMLKTGVIDVRGSSRDQILIGGAYICE